MHHTKSKISGMIPKSFKADKCKMLLRMAMSRMKLLRNKREIQVRQIRRDVAQLLQSGQVQTARIRVEHVIREEKTTAAYELLELYCELIVARLNIIDSQKNCPIDLREAISSVIFASPRCADVQELMDVRKQFLAKYGKEFTTAALELRPDCGVNHMIVEKLSAKAPDTETSIKTLKSIAEEHGIEWDSKALLDEIQKPKNDLLTTQFPSASQATMDHSANSSSHTSTQLPTHFLSASQVAMGYSATNSSATSVQISSQPKPTQFLSASEVTASYSDTSSGTNTSAGQISFAQPKNEDRTEGIVGKPPDDPVPHHGGIISSTGTVIYPPPPPPFMRFEEPAPSSIQSEFTSPEDSSREKKTEHKYKDAKAAARAAAESAEQAQMAARAAAELARRENEARRRTHTEEDIFTVPDAGLVEDAQKQSETENLRMHNDQVVQDYKSSEEEEEEITVHATGIEKENEYDVNSDKHEPSSAAVFDRSNSDIDDHSTNFLDTFFQPKKEGYASDFYWREKTDSIKQDRGESVFFENSTKESLPLQFMNSSVPTFDSDGLSSDDEDESEAKKKQPKYIYTEEREEGAASFASGLKNTRVTYDDDDDDDDDNDEPDLGLNLEKLTGGLKNKGYRRPPFVKKPINNSMSSVETLDDHDIYASSRTKKPPSSDVDEAAASYVLSEETERGEKGGKKSTSRFDAIYFNSEDEMEESEFQLALRRKQDATTSKVRKDDNIHFVKNRYPESSDEETTNENVVGKKSELEEHQTNSGASSAATSVRSKQPPDYDSLAAHFRSLRTNRP